MGNIKVLIVDDSSIIRKLLSKIIDDSPGMEVVGTAPDPYVARTKLMQLKPDVMTLDIEMPKMDGITFLSKVMQYHPIRTLILSSLSQKNSEIALAAFAAGAVDVMAKPKINIEGGLQDISREIVYKIKTVAQANIKNIAGSSGSVAKSTTETVKKVAILGKSLAQTTHQVFAIASSTGGTEALKKVLLALPPDLPGTLIVQHMPPVFTKNYADALDKMCPFRVKEAEDNDQVLPGTVLLAPGNFHMEIVRKGGYYYVKLHQEDKIHGVRPAADYLMNSVAVHAGGNAIGVVLTGMGKDGAKGLLAMKKAGAFNVAQDEETCVVFGMPKEAIKLGAIDKTVALEKIGETMVEQLKRQSL